MPATLSYTELLQHAAEAQALSRDVLQVTADFARSRHSSTRAGTAVLDHLATAVTMASHAAPAFAETAEAALSLPRTTHPSDRQHSKNRMVIDHATARAYLRRASESLRDAAKELDDHLGVQRFLAPLTRREGPPEPPPPRPGGLHR
ncbi:hypothetical protein [Streptomyces sp. DSM 118878]